MATGCEGDDSLPPSKFTPPKSAELHDMRLAALGDKQSRLRRSPSRLMCGRTAVGKTAGGA